MVFDHIINELTWFHFELKRQIYSEIESMLFIFLLYGFDFKFISNTSIEVVINWWDLSEWNK